MGRNNTQFFHVVKEQEYDVASILKDVYEALTEKGYNPVNQIVGYIMSGDPTYITSHKNARSLIMKVERDEILEVLFETLIPFLMASIIDKGVNTGDIHHIYKVGGIMIVAAFLGLLAGMAEDVMEQRLLQVSQRI